MNQLTHIDNEGRPAMVNVSGKTATLRSATAQSIVVLPPEVLEQFNGTDIRSAKGSVFQTAIIAGIMAAKKTGELIPLCHPLGLEDCRIDICFQQPGELTVTCTARLTGKTGVEMEALVGASIAALTIYDMCKALSHHIVIRDTRLLAKKGGKNDFGQP